MNIGKKSIPFKPEQDIPPLDGKVILITGGNIGLGKQCVLEYARHNPAQIWLAARSLDKAAAAVAEIQQQLPNPAPIKLLELDLSSLASVQTAARTFSAASARLDILMLNAGIMAAPPGLTTDGYELQWGTNYVGHALLAKLLLPVLDTTARSKPGADVRVITLSSHGHSLAPKPEGIRFDTLRTPADALGPYGRYGQSKLAAILWARQMAQRYPQFTVTSIHPGVVRTNLMNNATGSPLVVRLLGKVANWVVTPVEQGARNQLWASVAEGVESGEYYEPVGIGGTATAFGKDEKLAQKLWDWTEKELEGYTA
ncbi:retinol dehydrogenase 14 [Mytilinidion resinicola]|uniref:Retinol dehydrogenase 14 n=1 Tax=Mytilinidion resinicola TaxID=574789 RepID=A0A6A6Y8J0_9PEZI|nr:retinol dehydrogenase 14 [Mytilinidion resinicola]KAF2804873.1 retinol dehydrogenase 14 [Mytilinidion resinicola]